MVWKYEVDPAFGDECGQDHHSETGIEESIDDNNVFWRGEVGRDIWPEARITHHLRLVNEDVLYDIHGVLFETTEEFDQESAQETCKQCGLATHQLRLTSKGGRPYEDEYGIHLFKPFFLALAVDNLHS